MVLHTEQEELEEAAEDSERLAVELSEMLARLESEERKEKVFSLCVIPVEVGWRTHSWDSKHLFNPLVSRVQKKSAT